MLKRTEGIVLKSMLFGEADLIVTHLTRDYGLLKTFAKSPRKIKSRFGSSLEPLTCAKISFLGKEESSLPRLTQSDIIKPFHSLRENLRALLNITQILELNLSVLPEREPHPDLYNLLFSTLTHLESGPENPLPYLYYKIKFLQLSGFAPKLDMCGRCGRLASGNGDTSSSARNALSGNNRNGYHHFYISHGSILCEACISRGEDSISVSEGALKFYKSISCWNAAALSRVKAPDHLVGDIQEIIESHIQYVLGLKGIHRHFSTFKP